MIILFQNEFEKSSGALVRVCLDLFESLVWGIFPAVLSWVRAPVPYQEFQDTDLCDWTCFKRLYMKLNVNFKAKVISKMFIILLFTHPHVIQNKHAVILSVEHTHTHTKRVNIDRIFILAKRFLLPVVKECCICSWVCFETHLLWLFFYYYVFGKHGHTGPNMHHMKWLMIRVSVPCRQWLL